MRVVSVCVLLACCLALVVAQPDAAAVVAVPDAAPVAVAAVDVVPAASCPAVPACPVAAASTGVDAAAFAVVQRGVEDLVVSQVASSAELKAAQQVTDAKVAALALTLEQGLTKLYAADAAQTAADEAQQKSAAAAAAAAGTPNADASATAARLEAVERELSELKKVLSSFVATQTAQAAAAAAATAAAAAATPKTATADPILAEIKANQVLILAQLASATAPFSFDYEVLASQAKNSTIAGATKLSKFVQRTYATVLANYPQYLEQARVLGQQGLVHAEVFRVQAVQVSGDAQFKLTEILLSKGVPAEHVQNVIIGAFSLIVLLAVIIVFSILKCIAGCCCGCCCASKKKKQAAKSNKAGKAAAEEKRE